MCPNLARMSSIPSIHEFFSLINMDIASNSLTKPIPLVNQSQYTVRGEGCLISVVIFSLGLFLEDQMGPIHKYTRSKIGTVSSDVSFRHDKLFEKK